MANRAWFWGWMAAASCATLVEAQNYVANPEFDVDIAGWSNSRGVISWLDLDADGCDFDDASGSLISNALPFGGGFAADARSPCFAVTPGQTLCWAVQYQSPSRPVALLANRFLDTSCTLLAASAPTVGGPASATFTELGSCATLPVNVQGVRIEVGSSGASTFQIVTDRVYAGTIQRIFLDDFETESACRWED